MYFNSHSSPVRLDFKTIKMKTTQITKLAIYYADNDFSDLMKLVGEIIASSGCVEETNVLESIQLTIKYVCKVCFDSPAYAESVFNHLTHREDSSCPPKVFINEDADIFKEKSAGDCNYEVVLIDFNTQPNVKII